MKTIAGFSCLLFAVALSMSCLAHQSNKSIERTNNGDEFEVMITQNGNYFMPGQEFEMSVFSMCESVYQVIGVSIAGEKQAWKRGQVLTYRFIVEEESGSYEVPVVISFRNNKGQTRKKTYSVSFIVGMPVASVGLDKMNVLYIGVDNPINVAASGGGDDKLRISIEGGKGLISRVGHGKWNVKVSEITDDCRISVYIEEKIVGVSRFRVRDFPLPYGRVGGQTSGDSIFAKTFIAQEGVGADLKDFSFEIHYQVSGFNLNIQNEKGQIKSATCSGAYFSAEAKQLMSEHLKQGSIVTIGNLFALAPDGKKLKLLPLVYFIK